MILAAAPRHAAAESPSPLLTPPAARAEAERDITTDQLRRYLTFIASDALLGRDTPSPGLDAAAQFIAFNLSRDGLKPMGDDGTYFQKIALRRVVPDAGKSQAALRGDPVAFRIATDFVPALGLERGGSGNVPESPLVYVSNGWVIPSRKIDDYKGIDVRGKIIVVNGHGLPKGIGFIQLRSDSNRDSWVSPGAYAASHGARGIVYLPRSDENFAALGSEMRLGRGEIKPEDSGSDERSAEQDAVPAISISTDVARRLFVGEPINADDLLDNSEWGGESAGFDLKPEKRLAFAAVYTIDTVYTQNVVAMLEGGDLRDQFIAFGAHYDHLGVAAKPDKNGDRIYNGADDDGSGTTALLAMAEAFSRSDARPRRSLLFVWHCGEEKGLWGSDYFTRHPTVPLKRIAAQLNIDMIGRSKPGNDDDPRDVNLTGPDEIYVIGSKAMSTGLAAVSESVNRGYLDLKLNYKYDDPNDPEQLFYRSDHFNYARHGVPIIFYFDGVHADYHQVTDEISKIDFAKMQKVIWTIFLTATTLADQPNPPAVDVKLPFPVN